MHTSGVSNSERGEKDSSGRPRMMKWDVEAMQQKHRNKNVGILTTVCRRQERLRIQCSGHQGPVFQNDPTGLILLDCIKSWSDPKNCYFKANLILKIQIRESNPAFDPDKKTAVEYFKTLVGNLDQFDPKNQDYPDPTSEVDLREITCKGLNRLSVTAPKVLCLIQ